MLIEQLQALYSMLMRHLKEEPWLGCTTISTFEFNCAVQWRFEKENPLPFNGEIKKYKTKHSFILLNHFSSFSVRWWCSLVLAHYVLSICVLSVLSLWTWDWIYTGIKDQLFTFLSFFIFFFTFMFTLKISSSHGSKYSETNHFKVWHPNSKFLLL